MTWNIAYGGKEYKEAAGFTFIVGDRTEIGKCNRCRKNDQKLYLVGCHQHGHNGRDDTRLLVCLGCIKDVIEEEGEECLREAVEELEIEKRQDVDLQPPNDEN